MDPVALDRRVTLHRLSGRTDAMNEVDLTAWRELGEVWAGRRDLTDTERARAAQLEVAVSAQFMVRSSALTRSLGQGDALTDGGQWFDIKATRDPYSDDPKRRRTWLEIRAMARMAPGVAEG